MIIQPNVAKWKQFDINLVEYERVVLDEDKSQQKGSMIRWRQTSIDFDGSNE